MKSYATCFGLIFFCLIGLLTITDSQAQNQNALLDLRSCGLEGTSDNYIIKDIYLSNESGLALTQQEKDCLSGEKHNLFISVRYKTKSNIPAENARIFMDLKNGNNHEYLNLFMGSVPAAVSASKIVTLPYSFTWACGEELKLSNPLLAWTNSSDTDLSSTYDCNDYSFIQLESLGDYTLADNPANIKIKKEVDQTSISSPTNLNYTITVTNPGRINLTGVNVMDEMTNGDVPLSLVSGDEDQDGELDTNESWVYKTSYAVTQSDIDRGGKLVNKAVVSSNEAEKKCDDAVTKVEQVIGIKMVKSADKTESLKVGEIVTYTYRISNTGNTTVTDIYVTDDHPGNGAISEIMPTMVPSLGPGESIDFTASYEIVQEDIDAGGEITNIATGHATCAKNHKLKSVDEETISLEEGVSAVALTKVADKESYSVLGEEITYTLIVTNTGNVTLSNIKVTDPMTGLESVLASLAPGGSTAFTTVHKVTQADLEEGKVVNTAHVNAEDPNGEEVSDSASEESIASLTPIEANDDDFGVFNSSTGRVFGNILLNDLFNNSEINPEDVDFEFIDLDGIIGLQVDEEGLLTLPPDIAARAYTLRYELREKLNPSNKDQALVTFRIQANEVMPMDDQMITNMNQEITFDILANDVTTIHPLDPNSLAIISETANGSLTINADGTVTYVPDTDFSGTDTFTYQICDNSLPEVICGTAEVNIMVRPISMSLSKTVDVASLGLGEMATYTITLTNNSEFAVGNVILKDLLPAQMTFISTTLETTEDLTWLIDQIEAGETISFEIQVMATAEGEATNVVTLQAGNFELREEASTVLVENEEVDLSITKTSFGVEVYEGDEFNYEIVVNNIGGNDATDVIITDNLPSNVVMVGGSYTANSSEIVAEMTANGQQITWAVPFFPADGQITITLKVKAMEPGVIINQAVVGSAEEDKNPEDNTASDQNGIETFFIPNVITPGDMDNKNDQFVIKGLGKFEQNEIVILNRWGDHVFETKGYQQDWAAKGLNAGAYFYVLTVTDSLGEVHTFKGWIQVIKNGSKFDN